VSPPGCPLGEICPRVGARGGGVVESLPARHCGGMATPDGLVEARRAVLRAQRDVETWDVLWTRTRAWAPNAASVIAARRAAYSALDGLLTVLAEAQTDADAAVLAEAARDHVESET